MSVQGTFDSGAFDRDVFDSTPQAEWDGGWLRIYAGTRPVSIAGSVSGNTMLAETRLSDRACDVASGGVFPVTFVIGDGSVAASGVATFCRLFRADGVTVVVDGSVGVREADLLLNTNILKASGSVRITSLAESSGVIVGTGTVLPAYTRAVVEGSHVRPDRRRR